MIFKYGEMWSRWHDADLFLVTGNATLNERNNLVTWRGTLQEAAVRFKKSRIDESLGMAVARNGVKKEIGGHHVYNPYHLLVSPRWPEAKLGLFQTREFYSHAIDEQIVSFAVDALLEWLPRGRDELDRDPLVVMPFPGSGHGAMPVGVKVYLDRLPDNVEVWRSEGHAPFILPDDHELFPLLDCDGHDYMALLEQMLGMPRQQLDETCLELGIRLDMFSGRARLQRYFLIRSYRESGDPSGSWHTARNEMRQLASHD
jgi:hypothetical protein